MSESSTHFAPVPPVPPPSASGPDPRVGTAVGKYRLVRVLGRGGMGVVYEAEDTALGRKVAFKLLPGDESGDPDAPARFLREAKAAARLNHPNAVRVYDVDRHEGGYYLAMELVPGGSLQDRIKAGGRLRWDEAAAAVADVCRALSAAHAAGIVHRDIKPTNILVAAPVGDPRLTGVKLADFGLAKFGSGQATASLTGTGMVVGTPAYMSPEQCQAEPLDARSDIYSLGMTLYALLTGEPPFAGDRGPMQQMFAHCTQPTPDPRRLAPDIPATVVAVVHKATQKNPADRYQEAGAMLLALETAVADGRMSSSVRKLHALSQATVRRAVSKPSRSGASRPAWVVPAAAAGAVAVLTLAAWVFLRSSDPARPEPPPKKSAQLPPDADPPDAMPPDPMLPDPMPPDPTPPDRRPDPTPPPRDPVPVRVLPAHDGAVNGVAFSPDGKRLAAVDDAGMLVLWDPDTGARVQDLKGNAEARGFSAVGWLGHDRLAIGTGLGTPAVFAADDLRRPAVIADWRLPGPVRSISRSDETVMATGGDRGYVWWTVPRDPKLKPSAQVRPLQAPARCAVHFHTRFAVGQTDGSIEYGFLDANRLHARFPAHRGPVEAVASVWFCRWIVSGGTDGFVRVWDNFGDRLHQQRLGPPPEAHRELLSHAGGVTSLAISPWGDLVAAGGTDGNVRLLSLPDLEDRGVLRTGGGAVRTLDFRPASPGLSGAQVPLLATAGDDGRIRLWDWSSAVKWRFLPTAPPVSAHTAAARVAFSPDGKLAVSWSDDGSARLLTPDGRLREPLHRNPAGVAVTTAAFSGDGSSVATVSADGTVRFFRTADGAPTGSVRVDAGKFTVSAVSADHRRLAVGGHEPDARLFELPSGRPLGRLAIAMPGVAVLALSADGRTLAGCHYEDVRVWDVSTGTPWAARRRVADPVRSVALIAGDRGVAAFGYDGSILLMEDADGKPAAATERAAVIGVGSCVLILDPPTGRWSAVVAAPDRPFASVALSPDGRRGIAADVAGRLHPFETPPIEPAPPPAGPTPVRVLRAHPKAVNGVAFSPDGRRLASVDDGGALVLWDPDTGVPQQDVVAAQTNGLRSVLWLDDARLAVGAAIGRTAVVATDDIRRRGVTSGVQHAGPVTGLTLHAPHLVSVGGDRKFAWWALPPDLNPRSTVTIRPTLGDGISVSVGPGRFAVGRPDGIVELGILEDRPHVPVRLHQGPVRAVAFVGVCRWLLTGGADGVIHIVNTDGDPVGKAEAGKLESIAIPAAHAGGVTSLAVSPWGDLFASGGADGQVRFWSLPEGRRLGELPHGGPIRSVVFRSGVPGDARPAGHLLASAGDDGRVRLWDWSSLAGWRFLGAAAVWPGHTAPPRVAFSPDGRRLLSWSADGSSRLWDRAEGRMLRQLDRNDKGVAVTTGRFSADGSQVATVSADGTVRIWKAAAGDEGPVRTVRCDAGPFHAADVSPDLGSLAVVGPPKPDVGSLVRLWSLTSGAEAEPFVVRGGTLIAVTFSPDGRLLAVCEHAGVHIWEAATRRALPRSRFGHSLVEELQFADDRGGVLALRSNEALVRLQETATGRELAAIPVAGGFAYHPSGVAAGVGPGSRVELRDRTGRMLAATAEPVGSRPALSPDGRYLAAGGPDGSVRVWDLSVIPRGGR